jgi:hypothetical protein
MIDNVKQISAVLMAGIFANRNAIAPNTAAKLAVDGAIALIQELKNRVPDSVPTSTGTADKPRKKKSGS